MAISKIKLVGILSVLTVTSVMGQSSCVQLNSTMLTSCPCDDATLMFTLEGETTIAANTVNLALVLDGSGSVGSSDFKLEQNFAMDAVSAFADRNLFDNGGTASYVQYSYRVASSATFDTAQAFNTFVSKDKQLKGGTTTSLGINEGTRLLGVNPASASFMIVITDGKSSSITATKKAADAARAAGITVLAVGVALRAYTGSRGRAGSHTPRLCNTLDAWNAPITSPDAGSGTNAAELLAIGGDAANVFEVANFAKLKAALEVILSSGGGIVIPCESTAATLTIEFSVPVDSVSSGSISKNTVIFSVADLESNPADFEVMLDVCNEAPGGSIIVSANYADDQGNVPDLSLLTGMVIGNDFCAAPTPAPTKAPTLPPVHAPTAAPTRRTRKPRAVPSPTGGNLNVGEATDADYLGCYVPSNKVTPLDGPITTWEKMTTQACADSCFCLGYDYFATANGSECHCGSAEPVKKKKKGVCDVACTGDSSTACGGTGSISVYKTKVPDCNQNP